MDIMTKNDSTLRVRLNRELSKKFDELKKKYGFENNSELVRFLISSEYQRSFIINSIELGVPQIERG